MDSGVAQLVPLICCLDKSKNSNKSATVGQCSSPTIVLCVVTSGAGCDVARLLLGLNQSTRFFLQQKCVGRQCQYHPHSYPTEEGQVV